MADVTIGTDRVKRGMAEMLKGGVIMDVIDEEQAKLTAERRSLIRSGDRSEKIRTYNFPQDRLTDHRIGQNFHNLPGIMEGNIKPIIDALRQAEQSQKLSEK